MEPVSFSVFCKALEHLGVTVEPLEGEIQSALNEACRDLGNGELAYMVQRRLMGLGTPYRIIIGSAERRVADPELSEVLALVQLEPHEFGEAVRAVS